MDSRAELMRHLSTLSTNQVLRFLKDETLIEIARRAFGNGHGILTLPPEGSAVVASAVADTSASSDEVTPTAPNKTKQRPLNAFMAFRSNYVGIFPDFQQKTAAGFITLLWNRDPFRERWALLARVYTIIRNDIGKDRIILAHFLAYACPLMGIPRPDIYLAIFGWSIQGNVTAYQLVQNETLAAIGRAQLSPGPFPETDVELIEALVAINYLPDRGVDLIRRLSSARAIPVVDVVSPPAPPLPPVAHTTHKSQFINTARTNPDQATRDILANVVDTFAAQSLGARSQSHNVENLGSINHLPLQTQAPDPRCYYNYSTNTSQATANGAPTMTFDRIPDHESFDIDSPWDVDTIMDQSQSEGERTADHPESPQQHDAREDFHHTFG
ncbi:hypothetical protein QQS21_012765, partial [Conoideocrella luteorostrata]